MTIKRLVEILQPFCEQYPGSEVYIPNDAGDGKQDYPVCTVTLRFPGSDEDLPSVGIEGLG